MKLASPKKLEDGFALPIAIGVGVIMIIIATTMIIRSNQSQIASISQRSNYKSLAAAETGVAKYLDFLNRYREFASESSPNPSDSSTPSWVDYRNTIQNYPGCGNFANSEDILDNFGSAFDVDEVVDKEIKKGSYELEEYLVDGSTAKMKILGRADGTTAAGTTRLEVEFPVDRVPPLASTPVSPGTPISECQFLPGLKLQSSVTSFVAANLSDEIQINATIDSDITLPQDALGSKNANDKYFTYLLDPISSADLAINLAENEDIVIEDGKTVFLVTDQDINISGGRIVLGNDSRLFIISSGNVNLLQSANVNDFPPVFSTSFSSTTWPLQIFLTGEDSNASVSGSSTGGELNIEFSDDSGYVKTIPIAAYAPKGTVTLNGHNGTSDESPFKGIVWAPNFLVTPNPSSFVLEENVLASFDTTPADFPAFWKSRLNVANFANRIRPINSWKKVDLP